MIRGYALRLLYRALRRSGDVPIVSLSAEEQVQAHLIDSRRNLEKLGIDPDAINAESIHRVTASMGDPEKFAFYAKQLLEEAGYRDPPDTPPDEQ